MSTPRKTKNTCNINDLVAEREGFEPPVELPPRRISSAVHSTTLPPLREVMAVLRLVDTAGLMA